MNRQLAHWTSLTIAITAGISQAQEPAFLVSTTSDVGSVDPALPELTDADLIVVRAATAPRPWLTSDSWRALLQLAPGDVDAVALRPGEEPLGATSFVFSTLSNLPGYADGDVLAVDALGGLEVLVSESELVSGFGLEGVPIDVDGLSFDESGRLLFSLQSDLNGTLLGDVANGDVLRRELDGSLTRIATEADVEEALTLATSLAVSVGDVHGVDWVDGTLRVAIQAPGTHDGGILSLGAWPTLVVDETDLGLAGAELDAIATLPLETPDPVALWFAGSGAVRTAVVRGATPWGVGVALATPAWGFSAAGDFAGFGAFALDVNDAVLTAQLTSGLTLVPFDGDGHYESAVLVPIAGAGPIADGSFGWSFQVIDLATLALTPATRVDV